MQEKITTQKRCGDDVLIGLEHRDDFIGFFKKVMMDRGQHGDNCLNYNMAIRYVINFANSMELPFKKVNTEWLTSFKSYLKGARSFKNQSTLSTRSAATYFRIVYSVVREAIACNRIEAAVAKFTRVWHRTDASTLPLSIQELQKLAQTDCGQSVVKTAFLFSALTGIQWHELENLRWEHIKADEHGILTVNLTDQLNRRRFPLSDQAVVLLGSRKESPDKVFANLRWNAYLYVTLNKWAISGGILRTLTFHTARVTFAHLLNRENVPVEIISELLGHKNIKSTVRMIDTKSSSTA